MKKMIWMSLIMGAILAIATSGYAYYGQETVMEDTDATTTGQWTCGNEAGASGSNRCYTPNWNAGPNFVATMTWSPNVSGDFEIFATWTADTNRATNAPFTINHVNGTSVVKVNQKINHATWVSLGHYSLNSTSSIVLSSSGADSLVIGDAIKLLNLSSGANVSHTHAEADITGLVNDLDDIDDILNDLPPGLLNIDRNGDGN